MISSTRMTTMLGEFLTLGFINLGLVAIVGSILGYTALLDTDENKFKGWSRLLVGILIFGIVSIIGNFSTTTLGVAYNFRDGGVIAGGLFFGGYVGIGAAILSVAYRATLGGVTLIPCLMGTLFAGIISGYLYQRYRSKITVLSATLAALGIELIHTFLVIILTPDGQGMDVVFSTPAGWFIVMSTLSVLVFSLCYTTMKKKRN